MERRDFLTTTLGASILASSASDGLAQGKPAAAAAPYFIWRQYTLRSGPQTQRMTAFLKEAYMPALGRLGVKPVGVFNVSIGASSPTIHIFSPHPSADAAIALETQLENDSEFTKAASEYFNASVTDPAYVRQEVSLLQPFSNFQTIDVPAATASQGPRLFELRMYESPTEVAHHKKVDMFNKLGEVDIFRRVGIKPVFFSRTIIGPKVPNLVYLTVYDNLAAREKAWAAFGADADWKKLNATPGYENIVSNITITLLSPTPYSQI
jgi:hypothetical protein